MKFFNKYTPLLLAIVVGASVLQAVHAQGQSSKGMEVSRQQFVDMSQDMAEKASKQQAEMKQQQEASLRTTMNDEEFEKHQADTESHARAGEEKLATCLGISHSKLKSFEQTMNVDFQVKAIEKCSAKLPDIIKMSGLVDPTQNPELAPYVACMEDLAINKTGVSADRLKSCAQAQVE